MSFLIMFLIATSFIDSINPFGIGLQIILMGKLKKKAKIFYYISGIFLAYFIGGLALYSGAGLLLKDMAKAFDRIPDIVYFTVEIFIAVLLMIYALKLKISRNEKNTDEKKFADLSVLFLFTLGAGGTISDLPTALPYLAMIAKITEMKIAFFPSIILLLIYNLIFIAPLLILWFMYGFFESKLKEKFADLNEKLEKANIYIIKIFCIVVSIALFTDTVIYFIL